MIINRVSRSTYTIPLINFVGGLIIIVLFVVLDIRNFHDLQREQLLGESEPFSKQQSANLSRFTGHSEHVIIAMRHSEAFEKYLSTGDSYLLKPMFKFTINAESYATQIRFINAQGMEVIRYGRKTVNGDSFEVSEKDLQNKADSDYVRENIAQPERIWYSKLDLNKEHYKVEKPFKPTFRIVLPVWHQGTFRGMIVINYFAQVMLDRIINVDNYDIKMIDEEGYILYSSNAQEQWSRFAPKPYTIRDSIKGKISSTAVKTDDFALVPMHTPFQNRLWLVLIPSETYIHTQSTFEQQKMIKVSIIIAVITVLLSLLLYKILQRLNLELSDAKGQQKLQRHLLDEQENMLTMNRVINRYVITSNTDLNGIITYASQAFCEISGYSVEEMLGQSHRIVRHPDMGHEIYQEMWETITQNQTWTGEFKNRSKNGQFYWVHASISPLYNRTGEKIGYTAVREDITNAKLIKDEQEKLQSLSLRMDLALEAAVIGTWEWEYESNILIWDHRMYEIYGLQPQGCENTYTMWSDAIDPVDKAAVEEKLNNAVKTNGSFNATFWITTPDGERRYIRAIGKSENDAFGTVNCMVGINVDITDYKRNEELLNERVAEETSKRVAQEKLLIHQSKLAAMGEMMANIAHQWKQPLMMFSMGLLTLQKKFNKGDLNAEYMLGYSTKTKELIEKMNQTIGDFSQYFAPNKVAHKFSLEECIHKSVNFLDMIFKRHSIEVKLELIRDSQMVGFENELSQVLLNLLKNASDAIKEHSLVQGIILVKMEEFPKHWKIHVSDNGGGIPVEIIDRVFEPYFTTKFKSDGTGIGLYMSKMIVEQSLHGNLGVSNTQEGAMFTVTLPKEQ